MPVVIWRLKDLMKHILLLLDCLSLKTERKLNLTSCHCEVLLRPKNPIHLTLHLTVLFTAYKQEDLLERLRMSHSSFRLAGSRSRGETLLAGCSTADCWQPSYSPSSPQHLESPLTTLRYYEFPAVTNKSPTLFPTSLSSPHLPCVPRGLSQVALFWMFIKENTMKTLWEGTARGTWRAQRPLMEP